MAVTETPPQTVAASSEPAPRIRHQPTGLAAVLGAVFVWLTVGLLRKPTTEQAMRVFGYSITYVTLLFAAMAVDQLVRNVR